MVAETSGCAVARQLCTLEIIPAAGVLTRDKNATGGSPQSLVAIRSRWWPGRWIAILYTVPVVLRKVMSNNESIKS